MWLSVALLTLKDAVTGKLFYAPCLGSVVESRAKPDDIEKVVAAK